MVTVGSDTVFFSLISNLNTIGSAAVSDGIF